MTIISALADPCRQLLHAFLSFFFFLFLSNRCHSDAISVLIVCQGKTKNTSGLFVPYNQSNPINPFLSFLDTGPNTFFLLYVRRGCDEQTLCCCACIYFSFFILLNCVIRWPLLCHYGAQAWVEAAGEQGLALSLSLIDPPPHVPPLSFCPSVFLCLYFCLLSRSLSHSNS